MQTVTESLRRAGDRLAKSRLQVSDIGPLAVLLFLAILSGHARWGMGFGVPDSLWVLLAAVGVAYLPGVLLHRLLRTVPGFRDCGRNSNGVPHWIGCALTQLSLGLILFAISVGLVRRYGGGVAATAQFQITLTAFLVPAALFVGRRWNSPVSTRLSGWSALGFDRTEAVSDFEPAQRRIVRLLALLLIGLTLLAAWELARLGSYEHEDAWVHLAHVRDLLDDDCLDVADPLLGGDRIDVRYWGSLYHPFLATLARLAGVGHAEVWDSMSALLLPLAVLAIWAFGAVLFQSNLMGICSALLFLGVHGLVRPVDNYDDLRFLAYPGGVSLYLLTPLLWFQLWRWRIRGETIYLAILLGLTWVLLRTHLFYGLLFSGSVFLVMPILTLWAPKGESRTRVRSAVALLVVLVPLSLIVAARWDAVHDVNNPFFVEALQKMPPEHTLVVSDETTWRLSWEALFGYQGIRVFPSRLPRATVLLCIPLLWLVRRRHAGAVYLVTLSLFPILLNLCPPLLDFVNARISIHKLIRMGQLMPHAFVLGWGMERLLAGCTWFSMRLHPEALEERWPSRTGSTALFAFLTVAYIGLDAVEKRPMLCARDRWQAAVSEPRFDERPYGRRSVRQVGFIRFFAERPGERERVLSHGAESLLLAAYTGCDVVLVPTYHGSPAVGDLGERERDVHRIVRGTMEPDALRDWLTRYEVTSVTFRLSRKESSLTPEGMRLLDSCSVLIREDDAPDGYALWRRVG